MTGISSSRNQSNQSSRNQSSRQPCERCQGACELICGECRGTGESRSFRGAACVTCGGRGAVECDECDGVGVIPITLEVESIPLYSIGTWDIDTEAYTPQRGLSVPSINITLAELRQAIRELRQCGYTAHRFRDTDGSHDDNDWMVMIERTDGRSEEEILESWKRPSYVKVESE